uniref:AMT-like ammonia transporter n=1 Tax=Eurythoe complanata TaxID=167815 RepID=A0A1B3PEG0_EURCO|nr:AMT-like ammonia transporter [Eurythoe complanata]
MAATGIAVCTQFNTTYPSFTLTPSTTSATSLFFMHIGLTLMEAGVIRSKNVTNTFIKNILNFFVVALAYWAVGYAFAFGMESNVFIGYRNWFSENMPVGAYTGWAYHFLLCAIVVAIATSSLAERGEFMAYPIFAFILAAFVYPISTHWAWHIKGWLYAGADGVGFRDDGGSGVVFVTAGAAALVAAVFVGPRHGRFDNEDGQPIPIRAHSTPFVGLGALLIMLGFMGMTPTVTLMNLFLAATGGAIVAVILRKFGMCGQNGCCRGYETDNFSWGLLTIVNGAICGMVAVVGTGHLMYPWSAFVTGTVAGIAYCTWSFVSVTIKVDDPLDTVAVYLGGGFWGLMAGPLFSTVCGVVWSNQDTFQQTARWLGWNMLGGVAFLAWASLLCVLLFGILKCLRLLRVNHEVQARGLDVVIHRERAYPPEAYLDMDPTPYSDGSGSLSKPHKLGREAPQIGRDPSPRRRGYPYY